MTEPRDIEKDKALIVELLKFAPLEPEIIALHYITQYEAQQARIAELERKYEELEDQAARWREESGN